MYSLFFVRLVLEPKSKQSQSIPKILRNVFNYIQMFTTHDILGQRR